KEAFVQATFRELILCAHGKTDFEKEIEFLFEDFLEKDERLSASSEMVRSSYFYTFLKHKYLKLVCFWLSDTSDDRELTMEFTDKLTSFLQELMYNTIADRGLELGKFLYSNKKAFLDHIPIIKQLFSNI